jgi:hypothetical protein
VQQAHRKRGASGHDQVCGFTYGFGRIFCGARPEGSENAAKNRAIRLNKVLAGEACQNLIPLLSLARRKRAGSVIFLRFFYKNLVFLFLWDIL